MKNYTVLLLLPDYLASNYGLETFLSFVVAKGVRSAIRQAQRQARLELGAHLVGGRASDFAHLFVCLGHVDDLGAGIL